GSPPARPRARCGASWRPWPRHACLTLWPENGNFAAHTHPALKAARYAAWLGGVRMGGVQRRGVFTAPVLLTVLAVPAALIVLAGSGVVAYRVFRPRDMLTRPTVPYPSAVMITDERPVSEVRAAPLVIEGRLRVYAETWRVWSDAPVGGRYEATPYWAFRRFPAQVIGVVAAETAKGPYVITQWSDGLLVALDARAGSVAWRAMAPAAEQQYDGRLTGASTVYDPRSLLTGTVG